MTVPPNTIVDGEEIAPDCCIVCGKDFTADIEAGRMDYVYLAGAIPSGAVSCPGTCTDTAMRRDALTGRVDDAKRA